MLALKRQFSEDTEFRRLFQIRELSQYTSFVDKENAAVCTFGPVLESEVGNNHNSAP